LALFRVIYKRQFVSQVEEWAVKGAAEELSTKGADRAAAIHCFFLTKRLKHVFN
jgi:hypothetical protein